MSLSSKLKVLRFNAIRISSLLKFAGKNCFFDISSGKH